MFLKLLHIPLLLMNILIIAQKSKFRDKLIKHFKSIYSTVCIFNNFHIPANITKNKFDIIILEYKPDLPPVKDIRKKHEIPILVFANKEVSKKDITKAFNLGVDSFATAPLSIKEVQIRLNKILLRKRQMLFRNTLLNFGNITVDLCSRRIYRGAESIYLTPTEYVLFQYLILHKNHYVNKKALKNCLIEQGRDDHIINVHLHKLRKKLGAGAQILTMPRRGFMLRDV